MEALLEAVKEEVPLDDLNKSFRVYMSQTFWTRPGVKQELVLVRKEIDFWVDR